LSRRLGLRRLPSFPTRRSSDLAWFLVTDLLSNGGTWSTTVTLLFGIGAMLVGLAADRVYGFWVHVVAGLTIGVALLVFWHTTDTDRKSTRLNSSHVKISYAVFC